MQDFALSFISAAAHTADGQVGGLVDVNHSRYVVVGGTPLWFHVLITTANTGSSGRAKIQLRSSATKSSATVPILTGTINYIAETPTRAFTTLNEYFTVPIAHSLWHRYLQVYLDETTDGLAALKVKCWVGEAPQFHHAYPDAQK